uniref:AAA_12 domain-containing protein n=1 Tax=Haemonchus contortus TaxID=6289 RepID=A0A7I4Z269_HAECO
MRFPAPNIPFMFVDVKGESAQAPTRYICVITFYREQYRQIKPTLDSLNVELTTVDSVQGREKEGGAATEKNFNGESATTRHRERRPQAFHLIGAKPWTPRLYSP